MGACSSLSRTGGGGMRSGGSGSGGNGDVAAPAPLPTPPMAPWRHTMSTNSWSERATSGVVSESDAELMFRKLSPTVAGSTTLRATHSDVVTSCDTLARSTPATSATFRSSRSQASALSTPAFKAGVSVAAAAAAAPAAAAAAGTGRMHKVPTAVFGKAATAGNGATAGDGATAVTRAPVRARLTQKGRRHSWIHATMWVTGTSEPVSRTSPRSRPSPPFGKTEEEEEGEEEKKGQPGAQAATWRRQQSKVEERMHLEHAIRTAVKFRSTRTSPQGAGGAMHSDGDSDSGDGDSSLTVVDAVPPVLPRRYRRRHSHAHSRVRPPRRAVRRVLSVGCHDCLPPGVLESPQLAAPPPTASSVTPSSAMATASVTPTPAMVTSYETPSSAAAAPAVPASVTPPLVCVPRTAAELLVMAPAPETAAATSCSFDGLTVDIPTKAVHFNVNHDRTFVYDDDVDSLSDPDSAMEDWDTAAYELDMLPQTPFAWFATPAKPQP